MSEAFIIPPHLVAVTDSASSDAIVEPGDSTNRAVRVNIVAGGAASGVTHTDDAPFTPAVDDGIPIFGFFDDVAPDSVDEGDAGAVRMSGNRNLYMRIRDNAGNERGANVTAAAELNVLATAQPGVDIGDVTVNNTGGAGAVNIQDGGNSITVDGTVTATPPSATLGVTATAAVGVAVTLTIPAAGAGLFHFISRLQIAADTAPVALGANASAVVTSTNLPGTPAWNLSILRNGGGIDRDDESRPIPLRSSVANTATTIVAPATANTIWRLNVEYFTG